MIADFIMVRLQGRTASLHVSSDHKAVRKSKETTVADWLNIVVSRVKSIIRKQPKYCESLFVLFGTEQATSFSLRIGYGRAK